LVTPTLTLITALTLVAALRRPTGRRQRLALDAGRRPRVIPAGRPAIAGRRRHGAVIVLRELTIPGRRRGRIGAWAGRIVLRGLPQAFAAHPHNGRDSQAHPGRHPRGHAAADTVPAGHKVPAG